MRATVARILLALALTLSFLPQGFAASPAPTVPHFRSLAGEWRTLTVEPGNTLASLAKDAGFDLRLLLRINSLENPDLLVPGDRVTLDTRRIVPDLLDNGIVLDIAAGMLYLFEGGQLSARFPAGYGDASRPTPQGRYSVLFSRREPAWAHPPNVQEEAHRGALAWRRKALPEPPEELGPAWMQFSSWGWGIHQTSFEGALRGHRGAYQVRLAPDDLAALMKAAPAGTRVVSFYAPIRVATTSDGGIWLEVHPDVYGAGMPSPREVVAALGDAEGADEERIGVLIEQALGAPLRIATRARDRADAERALRAPGGDRLRLRCLDCPPGERRRVTLRAEALAPLLLEGEFPVEVLDEAGHTVFRAKNGQDVNPAMRVGDVRHYVWECTDSEGQPLPAGSYEVRLLFHAPGGRTEAAFLPLWLGR